MSFVGVADGDLVSSRIERSCDRGVGIISHQQLASSVITTTRDDVFGISDP